MTKGMFEQVKDFFRNLDAASWPAFFMFLVVLAAAGGLNYLQMQPIVGGPLAIGVAIFFGVGVLSWHIVESRKDDNQYQEDVAQTAKWLNAGLDGLLLVINLFRADLHLITLDGLTGWDAAAFVIIGISAVSHVVCFLLWTQNDPRRKLAKDNERALSVISRKRLEANNIIKETEAELSARKWIVKEEIRLREEYHDDLTQDELNRLVAEMKQTALRKFDKVAQSQNQAHRKPQERPGRTEVPLKVSYASEAELAEKAEISPTDGQERK